ncbi:MAG: metallophosphoesterase family protein [Candidatus Hydrogenedentales bacterium]|jgi:3',5'-cyclic AMP phosphodiesterase CpdA
MWRFIQLSDPHLGNQVHGTRNGRLESSLIPEVVSALRGDLVDLQPDFLLLTGDIARAHSRDAVFAARDLMDSLNTPYYPMGGQSDFRNEESRQWFVEAFGAHLPESQTYYSFTHKELHFCVLDPWWQWEDGSLMPFSDGNDVAPEWYIPSQQYDWLEADLEEHAGEATIIALHPPAILPENEAIREGLVRYGVLKNAQQLVDRLSRHAQVKLLLSGNVHAHYIARKQSLTQVVTGSLTEYPVEFRDVHVHEDRLEIRTRGLSNASYASQSQMYAAKWTRGGERDRYAVIPL